MKTFSFIGLLLLSFLCIFFKTESIEKDLTLRSTQAIQQANLPLPKIELDGRDIHISGMVDGEGIKNKIEQVISNVYGVRVVNNSLMIKEKKLPVVYDSATVQLQHQLNTMAINQKIEFTTGSSLLTSNSKHVLEEIAAVIKDGKISRLQIIGYTDNQGESNQNKILSQKRAESVKKYLVDQGIHTSILESIGRGSEEPVADNSTSIGRKKNRRVEFKIVKEK